MAKCLITGVSGFVGSHLAEYLVNKGDDVIGVMRKKEYAPNLKDVIDKIRIAECDIRDSSSVDNLIRTYMPERVFHLAAQSFVPYSWTHPEETITTNAIGSLHLFTAVLKHSPSTKIQVASSSEIYGRKDKIISEDDLPEPLSPYGVSKLTMDRLACQYVASYGMNIVITRAFNHTGPRRGAQFATSSFAKQIVSNPDVIKVGNLDAVRDWTDVRDIVRAYDMALDYCHFGVPYNICSETAVAVKDMLSTLLELSGKSIRVEKDPERMRPSDIPYLVGSSSRFKFVTGWHPQIPFRKTMEDLLEYWKTA